MICACALTQDEQQLLSPSQSKHGDQTATLPVYNVVHRVAETGLSLLTLLMDVCSIGGFLTERIRYLFNTILRRDRGPNTTRPTDYGDEKLLV